MSFQLRNQGNLRRLVTCSLVLLATAACGAPDDADVDQEPVPVDAGVPEPTDEPDDGPGEPDDTDESDDTDEPDDQDQARTFTLTVPSTGATLDLVADGSTVRVLRGPAKLRLIRTAVTRSTNQGLLAGTTLAQKCASFDAEPFTRGSIAPLEYGSFTFTLEYGPASPELRTAVRAELERRGWLPGGGGVQIQWAWAPVSAAFSYAAGARSPTIPATTGTTPRSVAAVGEDAFRIMFAVLARSPITAGGSLSIGYACDLVNRKATVTGSVATTPPIALELVIDPPAP